MPRSFRFDHFTAQKPNVSRKLKNKEKQRVATAAPEPAKTEGGLHYGKRHAETEELAKARAESAQHRPHSSVSPTSEEGPNAPPTSHDLRSAPEAEEGVAKRSTLAEEAIDVEAVPGRPRETTESGFSTARPRDVFAVLEDGRGQVEVLARSALEIGRGGPAPHSPLGRAGSDGREEHLAPTSR